MAFNYFKVSNQAGDERLIAMSPAMGPISRRHLASLEYAPIDVFYAQLFGSDKPDVMFAIADGQMSAADFDAALVRWLAEWAPDTDGPYDQHGNLIQSGEAPVGDADPLPEA